MTSGQMRAVLARNGVGKEVIVKVSDEIDIEKISMIIEAATNPKSAFNAIHAFYPQFEVEKMQEQMDSIRDLTDLWKSNWKAFAVDAAIAVGAAG